MFSAPQLQRLLRDEKRRRKGRSADLVFIGTHNVAQYWWCAMYAVLKSRANELQFFAAYLEDRINYALKLGRIARTPTKSAEILSAGKDVTLDDVQRFHPQTLGGRKLLQSEDPPSYRWWFPWDRYVIGEIPDGLTRDTVLERKNASNEYFAKTVARPVARTQADLYGYFYGRPRKLVEIEITEGAPALHLDEDVDEARALETLAKFRAVDVSGKAIRPKPEKCRHCEFNDSCPISQV